MSINPPSWGPGDGTTPPPLPPPPPREYGNAAGMPYGAYPGYGYGAPPPVVKRPPKKLWLVLGVVLIVLGILSAAIGVGSIATLMDTVPGTETTFTAGESTTVHFDAGARRVIFATTDAAKHDLHCDVSSLEGSGGIEIRQYDGTFTLNEWQAIFTVNVERASDYTIACTGETGDKFGVGGDASASSLVVGILCIVGGGFITVLGLVVTIIAAVLRSRRRKAISL